MFKIGDLVQYKIPNKNYNSQLEVINNDRLGVVLQSDIMYTTVLWCDIIDEDNEGYIKTNWLIKIN